MTTPADDSRFRTGIAKSLQTFAEKQRSLLAEIDTEAAALADAALSFAEGGKLLRPTFCHAGWLIAGGEPSADRIVETAAAFEWLQASALVHDDLMDESDTRRGRPSVHREHEYWHEEHQLLGDSAQHGARVAILLGDLLLSWADEAFHQAGPDVRTAHLWARCKNEVISGQYLDVLAQTQARLTVEAALKVVRFKTAKYTIERPLHVGASLAGADEDLLRALSDVAIPLGEAFQLRDDLLGVYGDPEETGKPAGDDLREGKRTVLLAHATALGDPELIYSILGTEEGAERLGALFQEWGAVAAVEDDISRLVEQTEMAIDRLGEHGKRVLAPLVAMTIHRNR